MARGKGKFMSKQTHQYHLVDPSPYPILSTIALFVLAIGAILFMHHKPIGNILLPVGVGSIVMVLIMWWKKVILEGRDDHAHTTPVQHGLRMGMMLFITSEVMFFFGFFFSFFSSSLAPTDVFNGETWPVSEGIWPPAGIVTFNPWELPFLNTIILLTSSFTVNIAHHAVVKGDQAKAARWLIVTVLLGMIFTACQAFEYHHAHFGFKDGIYASNFYLATGFHGFHVIVGTLFLAVCLVRARAGTLTQKGHLGLEFASWYWHFVDVVWIFLFTWVYVWGG